MLLTLTLVLALSSCELIYVFHEYKDENCDHLCDSCGEIISICIDENSDHKCDICKELFTKCTDMNGDLYCDVCEKLLYDMNSGKDENEKCKCQDEDKDHFCDKCGVRTDDCQDGTDSYHDCDKCGKSLCTDKDKNCRCDECGRRLCTDNDKDHFCEMCKTPLCFDGSDRGHRCDVCGLSLCSDSDGDHLCDGCDEFVCSGCSEHIFPLITVYAEGANVLVNGEKSVSFYGGEESYSVLPTYRASRFTLSFWTVYNEDNDPVEVLENGKKFTPKEAGKYYIVPTFELEDFDCVTDSEVSLDGWAADDSLSLSVEPKNPENAILLWHSDGQGAGSCFIKFDISKDSVGERIIAEFDYYLDYTYCCENSLLDLIISDGERSLTVGRIEQTALFHGCESGNLGSPIGKAARIYACLPSDVGLMPEVAVSTDVWYKIRIVIEEQSAGLYVGFRDSDSLTLIGRVDLSDTGINAEALTAFFISAEQNGNNTSIMLDNIFFGPAHDCTDGDEDHLCDLCQKALCLDGDDADHSCDVCGAELCSDGEMPDHACNYCGRVMSKCNDGDRSHYCDICGGGEFGGPCFDGEDGDHLCDYCQRSLCIDTDGNSVCDVCKNII